MTSNRRECQGPKIAKNTALREKKIREVTAVKRRVDYDIRVLRTLSCDPHAHVMLSDEAPKKGAPAAACTSCRTVRWVELVRNYA